MILPEVIGLKLSGKLNNGITTRACLIKGGWLEVDTFDDLKLYESLKKNGKINLLFNENS